MPTSFQIIVNNAAPAGEEGATGTFQITCDGPAPGSWSTQLGWSALITNPTLQQAEFDIPVAYVGTQAAGGFGWPDGDYVLTALSIVPGSGMPDNAVLVKPLTGFKFSLPNPPLAEVAGEP